MATTTANRNEQMEQQRLTSTVSSDVTGDGHDDFVACANGTTLRLGEDGLIIRCMPFTELKIREIYWIDN